jgi:nucleoside-diphosphate-sugar epimerase
MFRPIARWGVHVVPGGANWDRRLSLLHVDDLVEGLLLASESGERLGAHARAVDAWRGQGIYYFSGEEHPTYVQLGQMIAAALKKTPPMIVRVPAPLMRCIGIGGDVIGLLRHRPSWINSDKMTEALAGSWTCSSAKAREQLGWSPAAPLVDRMNETAQWYRQMGWL